MSDDAQPLPPLPRLPPSEAEMAAWLHLIVRGDELDGGVVQHQDGDVAHRTQVDDEKVVGQAMQKMEKLQTSTEGNCCAEDSTRSNSREMSMKTTAAGARKSHAAAEKKRRCKINERIRTLRQLVPGCDKCNQASTLDQTIKYVKSLQQQIQELSFGGTMEPASRAVYPVPGGLPLTPAAAPGALVSGHASPAVVLGPRPGPAIFPFASSFRLVQHPAIILPAAPMLYPNVAPLPTTACRPASAACREEESNN